MTRRPRPPAAGGWPGRAPKDGSIADRTYIGLRDPDGTAHVAVEDRRGRRRPLRHAAVHSPTGFEWGYGGSGPADLALALLLDALGEASRLPRSCFGPHSQAIADIVDRTRAWRLHQAFKWRVIARLPRHVPAHRPYAEAPVADVLPAVEEWRLRADDIRRTAEELDVQARS
jgi:hypothetical protein